MPIDAQNINFLNNGEPLNATVLNRPSEELLVAINAALEQLSIDHSTSNLVANGGDLTVVPMSELQGQVSVNLPLANSVPENTMLPVVITKTYSGGQKVLNRQGSDTVTDGTTTDTSYTIEDGFFGTLYFISNGVDEWRF